MNDLPDFDTSRKPHRAENYIKHVLSHGGDTYLRNFHAYDDGHFRAVFDGAYFVLQEGADEPTKSQWNTLKKRMKRVDKQVFIFRDHGRTKDGLYWIDFGFFVD